MYYQSEINKKSRGFRDTAKKLRLSEIAYNTVFHELMESIQANLDKHKYLIENGVEVN